MMLALKYYIVARTRIIQIAVGKFPVSEIRVDYLNGLERWDDDMRQAFLFTSEDGAERAIDLHCQPDTFYQVKPYYAQKS
jgi:hypothetical protein